MYGNGTMRKPRMCVSAGFILHMIHPQPSSPPPEQVGEGERVRVRAGRLPTESRRLCRNRRRSSSTNNSSKQQHQHQQQHQQQQQRHQQDMGTEGEACEEGKSRQIPPPEDEGPGSGKGGSLIDSLQLAGKRRLIVLAPEGRGLEARRTHEKKTRDRRCRY